MEASVSVALLLLCRPLELSEKDEEADDELEEDDVGECRLIALEKDLLCCAASSSIGVGFLLLAKSDLR